MNKALYILGALAIKLLLDVPMMLLGLVLVPLGMAQGFTRWLWPWGNDDHPDFGGEFWRKKCGVSWWCSYKWFALRNPAFNWGKYVLGIKWRPYSLEGKVGIGDKRAGGAYWCFASPYFEYYRIIPYGKRCIRIRIGWKLYGKTWNDYCQFCFVVNPFMTYSGK